MLGRLLLVAFVAVWMLAASGCGSDEDPAPSTAAEATTDETTTPSPPRDLTLLAAKRSVQTYYQSVDSGNFATAWRYLSREPRVEFGGFGTWKDGYGTTVSTDLSRAS